MTTPPRIDRRRALGLLAGAGAGAVVLGACGGGGGYPASGGSPTTTGGGGGSSPTTAGAATTGTAGAAAPGAGALTAGDFGTASSCALTPEQTEGPYHLDVDQIRGDIREDRQGTPLRVAARVVDADGCTPLKDAVFEIWHCDAGGLYSGFEAASRGTGGGGRGPVDDTRYLRGAQVTNADGIAEILTIYPGWYQGRTVHIHAKVHLSNAEALTTQLYFDDAVTDAAYRAAPYSSRPNRSTRNDDDGIYRPQTTLTVSEDGDGFLGLITLAVRR
jgi:protocatechuate 3,4-dioxygenase beta subunit